MRWKDQQDRWRECSAGPKRGDAEILKGEIVKQLLEQNSTYGKTISFSDFCWEYLDARESQLKPSTKSDYQRAIRNYFIPYFQKMPLGKITPQDVQDFMLHLKRNPKLSKATQAKLYRYLKTMLRHAYKLEIIPRDPTIATRAPRYEKKEMDFLSPEEIVRLLNATEDNAKKALFALSAYAGLRQGEVLALVWGDIDFASGTIDINKTYHYEYGVGTPKTKASRRKVPMPPTLIKILQAHWKDSENTSHNTLIFANRNGKPIDRRNLIRRDFTRALEAAGLKKITFHGLRHSFASACIAAGTNAKTLQKILGHTSITMTMDTYVHLFDTSYEKHVTGFEELISQADKLSQE